MLLIYTITMTARLGSISAISAVEAKIVKTFKRQTEGQIGALHVNPDNVPSETRSRLEWIRDGLIDDLDANFLWIF